MVGFTSTLSVDEFVAAREAGFRPLGQVLGSCFYHVGWRQYPVAYGVSWGGGFAELDVLTDALNASRDLALDRLAGEALQLGAQAVCGVRLEQGGYEWSGGALETTAIGTAVRSDRYEIDEGIAISNLSGQDFWKLWSAGYWPVGIVAGAVACYVVPGQQTRYARNSLMGQMANVELADYTQALTEARTLAMRRVRAAASAVGATGVVGIDLRLEHQEREVEQNGRRIDLIVTVQALGTGIVELASRPEPPPITYALSMSEEAR